MPKLSKEENVRRISRASELLAECGLDKYVEYNPKIYTPTQYLDLAIRFWMPFLKKKMRSQAYKQKHKEYLATDIWAKKRKERFSIDNGKCCDCGAAAQCVHHKHYKTWRNESVKEDLISLCNNCHYKRHFG